MSSFINKIITILIMPPQKHALFKKIQKYKRKLLKKNYAFLAPVPQHLSPF